MSTTNCPRCDRAECGSVTCEDERAYVIPVPDLVPDCGGEPVDWRARCLKAEAERDDALANAARLREALEALYGYGDHTEACVRRRGESGVAQRSSACHCGLLDAQTAARAALARPACSTCGETGEVGCTHERRRCHSDQCALSYPYATSALCSCPIVLPCEVVGCDGKRRPCPDCRPVCSTCGGTGKHPHPLHASGGANVDPCPDCQPGKEQASGICPTCSAITGPGSDHGAADCGGVLSDDAVRAGVEAVARAIHDATVDGQADDDLPVRFARALTDRDALVAAFRAGAGS